MATSRPGSCHLTHITNKTWTSRFLTTDQLVFLDWQPKYSSNSLAFSSSVFSLTCPSSMGCLENEERSNMTSLTNAQPPILSLYPLSGRPPTIPRLVACSMWKSTASLPHSWCRYSPWLLYQRMTTWTLFPCLDELHDLCILVGQELLTGLVGQLTLLRNHLAVSHIALLLFTTAGPCRIRRGWFESS